MGCEEYLSSLKEYCTVAKQNDFPQFRSSDFLGSALTIQDLYMPVRLQETNIYGEAVNEGIHQQKTPFCLENVFCLQSAPGGGKTMFIKMLIQALMEQDKEFLDFVYEQTGMKISENVLPIYIDLRGLNENLSEVKALFEQERIEKILYYLAGCILEKPLQEICNFEDFSSMLHDKTRPALLFLDGWSEICDLEIQKKLDASIHWYLSLENGICSVFLARRSKDSVPTFLKVRERDTILESEAKCYEICPLDKEGIKEFCRIYYENVYKNAKKKMLSYKDVANQIMERQGSALISDLSAKPFTLSILLLVTREEGRLPRNDAQICAKFLDIYLGWIVQKNEGIRQKRGMLVLLSYLALYLFKVDLKEKSLGNYCTKQQLLMAIHDCIDGFPGIFENVTQEHISLIIRQIESTVFGRQGANLYGFFDIPMLLYLAAHAFVHHYDTDDEYGDMSTVEILKNKFEAPSWNSITAFAALMHSGIREALLKNLIHRLEKKDEYSPVGYLYSFLYWDVPMKKADANRIYDFAFSESFGIWTEHQLIYIGSIFRGRKERYEDIKSYLSDHFAESIKDGHSKYGFSMAVIQTYDLAEQGKRPMEEAEQYIINGNETEKILGFYMLAMYGWAISNKMVMNLPLTGDFRLYKPSDQLLTTVRQLLIQCFRLEDIAPCIANCEEAGLFSFHAFQS